MRLRPLVIALGVGTIAIPLRAQESLVATCERAPAADQCYDAALRAARDLLEDSAARHNGTPAMQREIVDVLRRGCKEGRGEACYVAGVLVSASLAPSTHPDHFQAFAEDSAAMWRADSLATSLYAQGCQARVRSAAACHLAGLAYASGRGREQSDSVAVIYFWTGCTAGNATACYRLGTRDLAELGPGWRTRADSLSLVACRFGSSAGCNSAAVDMELAAATLPPASSAFRRAMLRVREQYVAACDEGNGSLIACSNAGLSHTEYQVGQVNADSARYYLELACFGPADRDSLTKGEGRGCVNLGEALLEGSVIAADTAAAMRFFELGCALVDPSACARYADVAHDTRRISSTDAILQAASWCYTESGYACLITGSLYEERGEPTRAVTFYAKACDLREARGCTRAASISAKPERVWHGALTHFLARALDQAIIRQDLRQQGALIDHVRNDVRDALLPQVPQLEGSTESLVLGGMPTMADSSSGNDGSRTSPRRIALLIGVADYQHFGSSTPLTDLKGSANDVRRMKASLERWGFGGTDDTRVLLDTAATKEGILNGFRWVAGRTRNAEDIVVVFFSGHGAHTPDGADGDEPDGRDEAIVPYEAVNADDPAALVLDDEIRRQLMTVRTSNVTVIVDAVYSGTVTDHVADSAGKSPHTLIAASRSDQTAQELPVDIANSALQVKYLRHACDLQSEAGCLALADLLASDPRSQPARLYDRACRAGAAEGCWKAARQHLADGEEEEAARARGDACRLDVQYCKKAM